MNIYKFNVKCLLLSCGMLSTSGVLAISLMLQANTAEVFISNPQLSLQSAVNETDILHPTNKMKPKSYGLGLELVYDFHNSWINHIISSVALGVDWHYYNAISQGDVYEDGSPALANDSYSLKFHANQAYLNGYVFSKYMFHRIRLFVDGGIGKSWNTASYNDVYKYNSQMSGIQLAKKTQAMNAFDYGAGLNINVTKMVNIVLGYSYYNQGKVATSQSDFHKELSFPLTSNMIYGGFSIIL